MREVGVTDRANKTLRIKKGLDPEHRGEGCYQYRWILFTRQAMKGPGRDGSEGTRSECKKDSPGPVMVSDTLCPAVHMLGT